MKTQRWHKYYVIKSEQEFYALIEKKLRDEGLELLETVREAAERKGRERYFLASLP